MTALDECIAAVVAAGEQRDRTNADAERRHDKAVVEAGAELEAALARHDKAVAAADAERQATTEAAAAAYRAAEAEAEAALDAAKMREHDATDARVEQGGGTMWLKVGRRQTLGSASPNHGGHWRVNGPAGILIVPDRLTARARLWDTLADEQPEGLQAHLHPLELAAAPRR